MKRGMPFQDGKHLRRHRVCNERVAPGEESIGKYANRKNVALRTRSFAQELFRRHCAGRTGDDRCRTIDLVGHDRGDPEIDDFRSVIGEHHVGGLEVAVDNTRLVCDLKAFANLDDGTQRSVDGELILPKCHVERGAANELHHEKRCSFSCFPAVEYLNEAGRREASENRGLAPEATDGPFVAFGRPSENLYCRHPAQADVPRLVDHAHRSATQFTAQLVPASQHLLGQRNHSKSIRPCLPNATGRGRGFGCSRPSCAPSRTVRHGRAASAQRSPRLREPRDMLSVPFAPTSGATAYVARRAEEGTDVFDLRTRKKVANLADLPDAPRIDGTGDDVVVTSGRASADGAMRCSLSSAKCHPLEGVPCAPMIVAGGRGLCVGSAGERSAMTRFELGDPSRTRVISVLHMVIGAYPASDGWVLQATRTIGKGHSDTVMTHLAERTTNGDALVWTNVAGEVIGVEGETAVVERNPSTFELVDLPTRKSSIVVMESKGALKILPDGYVAFFGDRTEAEKELVCIEGDRALPWSECRNREVPW